MPVLPIHEHDAMPDEKLISMPVLSIHEHGAMPDEKKHYKHAGLVNT